jgi:hypothetical protein
MMADVGKYCGEISIKTLHFTGLDSFWCEWSVKAVALACKKGRYQAWIKDSSTIYVDGGEEEKVNRAREKTNVDDVHHWLVLSATGKAFYLHQGPSQTCN